MALQTDLSRSPYFDDYSVNKNFYRVLYRPGVALQTRELNQMQSIMQDQIEKFGRFVFKDGSVTEGCSFTFDDNYTYVKINDNYSNNFAYTITDFTNRVVTNDNGLQAIIIDTVTGYESQDPDLNTLYIKYLNTVSYPNGSPQPTFANGENLAIATSAGVPVGNVTAASVANNVGSGYAFTTTAGVIFKKGFFISVDPQTIIISKYDSNPDNISVGFSALENIITPEADSSLYDNAAGSPNYVAPGAHRLQLMPTLVTRTTTELGNTASFFSLCDFKAGKPVSIKNTPQLASLGSELAKRTYETNGNYVVYPFVLSTDSKAPADANNVTYNNLVSSRGLGYVEGYRVEFVNNNKIDLRKGTDYQTLTGQTVSANFGYYVFVNDYCGEFNTGTGIVQLELHSTAKNAIYAKTFLSGYSSATKIGTAYARGMTYDSGTIGSWDSQYRVYLFNVQMLPGYNFSQVKSIISYNSTMLGVADVIQSYNAQANTYGAAIQQGKYSNMLYPIGQKASKLDGFKNTSYVYRARSNSSFANVSAATATMTLGLPTIHGTGTEVIYRTGSPLTGSSTYPYLVVPSSDGFTFNKTGTVAVSTTSTNTGSSNVVGTGTLFLTEYMVGDFIYINSLKREIGFIGNNVFLQVKVPFANTDSAAANTHKKVFPAGVPIDFSKTNGTISRSITATTTSITYTLGETVNTAFQAFGYYDVLRSGTVPVAKSIVKHTYVQVNCSSAGVTGPFSLGFPDVNKINGIYIGQSGSYANSGVNYLTSFYFDNGQRDSHYDLASISVINSGVLTANSRILVDMDVFTYNQSAGVGFFNGNSYPVDANTANVSSITISEIPQYTAQDGAVFDLRDSIDFRPFASNTANPAANSTNWTSIATTNPSATLAFTAPYGQTYLPTPDSIMQTDHQHYLGRIDRVVLRTDGSLAIIEGAANNSPVPPPDQAGSMTLGLATIPAYPSLSTTDAKLYKRYDYAITTSITQNKRYTMKDINVLSNKIDNLEYYTSLSLLETSAKNTLVRSSATGQNRFQNGILVDAFAGHDIGNTLDPNYHIAIDSSKTELRPPFQYFNRPLQFSAAKSSGVVKKGQMVLLNYTSVPYIKQGFANKYRNCIDGNIFTWRGDITFDPPGSTMPEVNKSPDVVTNIDLSSNWVNLGASAFGSQWGSWNSTPQTATSLGPASTTSVTDAYGNIINTTNQQQTTTTTTDSQRQGNKLNVSTSTNQYNLGTFVTDVSILPYVKSINVRVTCHGLKPNTRVYVFMNNTDVNGWFQQMDSSFSNYLKMYDQTPNPHYTPAVVPVGLTSPGFYTDETGSIYGAFTIPPNTFRATTLEMKIVDVDDLVAGADAITTQGDGTFYGSNISISKGSSILSATEATVSVKEVTESSHTIGIETKNIQTVVVIPAPQPDPDPNPSYNDGPCCFDPNAKVLMADGAWKRIEDVEVGDSVRGLESNNKVIGTKTTTVQKRKMIKFDGYDFYSTDDHLFLTHNGWKTWRPDRLVDNVTENSVFLEGENKHHPIDKDDMLVTVNRKMIPYSDLVVEELDFDANFIVHDLHLDGDSTYVIEGFVVHNCGGCGGSSGGGCGSG